MKNPNGYGSVVKLSGNRRKPFVVRKTIGRNEKGHPIYNTIGYTSTREEGMVLLAKFNWDPWDVDKSKITFEELFILFNTKKAVKLGKSSRRALLYAYNHCKPLYSMKYKEVKAFHMQDCIDGCGFGYSTQGAIKNLLRHLDRFALELDIVTRCYSSLLTSSTIPDTNKTPFTDDEISTIWGFETFPWVDSLIVLLYTGFRISELLDLRICNVDLAQGTIQGGTKTRAGKDRIVPIHCKILPIIQDKVQCGGEYLFGNSNLPSKNSNKKVSISMYYKHWNKIMKSTNLNHTPHECRHTFRSRLDSHGANKRCIDLLMGHKSKDVGERVYTHKTIHQLRLAVDLLD